MKDVLVMTRKIIFTLVCASVLSGCTTTTIKTYDGPRRPRSEVARIQVRGVRGVSIIRVNDREDSYHPHIEVLPGTTTLDVRQEKGAQQSKSISISFEAEAGMTYDLASIRIVRHPYATEWSPVIFRDLTSEVVATASESVPDLYNPYDYIDLRYEGTVSQVYSGPRKSSSEVAVLKRYPPLYINRINDYSIPSQSRRSKGDRYELLPGRQKVSVSYGGILTGGLRNPGSPMQLNFDAEAGVEYRLEFLRIRGARSLPHMTSRVAYRVIPLIRNLETDEIVVSLK